MAKSGIQGGAVYVPFQGDLSGLQSSVAQAKTIVGQAAKDMEKMARVPIGGAGSTSVAAATQLGTDTASAVRAGNIAAKFRDFQAKEVQRGENETIRAGAIATYQQTTGNIFRDKQQKDFERTIQRQRADDRLERVRNSMAYESRNGPGMDALEDAARYEARAGKKINAAEKAKFENKASAGEWNLGATVAAVAALGYAAVNAAHNMQTASAQFSYARGRLGGIAGRLTGMGLGGENAGVMSDLQVANAQAELDKAQAIYSSPLGIGANLADLATGKNKLHTRIVALQEAQDEAQATSRGLDVQSSIRIRNEGARGGSLRDPLLALARQQEEELRPLLLAKAKFPNNTTVRDAILQMKSTQTDEYMIASAQRGAALGSLSAAAGAESLRGMGLQAQFAGKNRDMLTAELAQKSLADKAEEGIAMANAPEDAKPLIRAGFANRRANLALEARERLRELSENPGTALVTSAGEAGAFPGMRDVNGETNSLLGRIATLLANIEQNTKGH